MQQTLVIVKPDGVQRQLVGNILARFEGKGIKIVGLRLLSVSQKQASTLYSVHKGKPFYDSLMKFITSGPVCVMCLEGPRVIAVVRKLMGKTFGYDAEPGTIRGDLGLSKSFNLVHGSDSAESAKRELPIFFEKTDLVSYELPDDRWIFDAREDVEETV